MSSSFLNSFASFSAAVSSTGRGLNSNGAPGLLSQGLLSLATKPCVGGTIRPAGSAR
jgi:hypothetical protein